MDNEKIIEQLFLIMTDIDARHSGGGEHCLSILTWNELCDMGIDLFNQLKRVK